MRFSYEDVCLGRQGNSQGNKRIRPPDDDEVQPPPPPPPVNDEVEMLDPILANINLDEDEEVDRPHGDAGSDVEPLIFAIEADEREQLGEAQEESDSATEPEPEMPSAQERSAAYDRHFVEESRRRQERKYGNDIQDFDDNGNPLPTAKFVAKESIYLVPDYVDDIFEYLRLRQADFVVNDYMHRHMAIGIEERAFLVNWLVRAQMQCRISHEVLYLSVRILDLFFTQTTLIINRHQAMAIAAASFFLASKIDEREHVLLADIVYLARMCVTSAEIRKCEFLIFSTLDFALGAPVAYRFLCRFSRSTGTDMRTNILSCYILEISLLFYQLLSIDEDKKAAAALLLARRIRMVTWTPQCQTITTFAESELVPLMWTMNHAVILRQQRYFYLGCSHAKFAHPNYLSVADLSMLPDLYTPGDPDLSVPIFGEF